jgi:hypothetical protein
LNAEKTKIAVFKNVGKLRKNEKWGLGTVEQRATNNIKYLNAIWDNRETEM